MSTPKCGACLKSVYPTEKVDAVGKAWHKGCFKCQGEGCGISLNLNNFKGHEGKVYCAQHVPKPKATSVADSVATKTALAAPKKTAEGLGTAQKGTGEKPTVGLDSVSTQQALKAPKKTAEGLGTAQKGSGDKPTVGLDSISTQSALKAPKASSESLGHVHKGERKPGDDESEQYHTHHDVEHEVEPEPEPEPEQDPEADQE